MRFSYFQINEGLTKVLLVKGIWKDSKWAFPRGKIEDGEDFQTCAVREVEEETGFDCSDRLNKDDFVDDKDGVQFQRLYFISGVPDSTKFSAENRFEIERISWHEIASLPSNSCYASRLARRIQNWVNSKSGSGVSERVTGLGSQATAASTAEASAGITHRQILDGLRLPKLTSEFRLSPNGSRCFVG